MRIYVFTHRDVHFFVMAHDVGAARHILQHYTSEEVAVQAEATDVGLSFAVHPRGPGGCYVSVENL